MEVSSPRLVSPVDFMFKPAAGMLYCKLISPARVAEWIMVDGLKKDYFWKPQAEQENTFLQIWNP